MKVARRRSEHRADEADAIRLAEADEQVDEESRKNFYDKTYELAAGAVDRSRNAADTLQKSGAAIVSIYSGVLAVVFTVTRNPFPLTGLLTPTFIGISIACCAAYSGLIGAGDKIPFVSPLDRTLVSQRELRAFTRYSIFSQVASELATRRIWLLHTSVSALAIGVIFLAAPFVEIQGPATEKPGRSINDYNLTAWPTPPAASANSDTARILYQKQLDEIGNLRQQELTASRDARDRVAATWLGLGGLLAVIAVGAVSRLRYSVHRQRILRPKIGAPAGGAQLPAQRPPDGRALSQTARQDTL